MVTKLSVEQFTEMSGCEVEDIQVNLDSNIVAVYVGGEECPFTGAEYSDGTFSICGTRHDAVVSYDDMVALLESC